MADDVQTPVAESSPAPASTPSAPAADNGTMSIPKDPKAYAEWRQTGKLPEPKSEAKPSKDESAPSKPKPSEDESATSKPSSDESAPSDKRQERGNRTEARKEEINREIRDLLARRDQLRQEVEGGTKKDVKPESSPEPENQRPVKPKQDEFDSWEKYEAAQDKYLEDLADWKAAQRIEEHTIRQQQESATREMQNRLNEAKSRYGEEAEPKIIETARSVFDDKQVAPAIKSALGRSHVLVDALYVMGSDQKELSDFIDLAKNDPLEALRKWFTVEALVKQELDKASASKAEGATRSESATPARGTDGKFLPEKPVKTKDAPAPPTELNGNSSPPGDERVRAADRGDFRAFKAEADRRDLARIRGQG